MRRAVFICGDSISIQYGKQMEDIVSDGIKIERAEVFSEDQNGFMPYNCEDSRKLIKYLFDARKYGGKFDILLINCGLHDIKRNTLNGEIQVPEDEYKVNVEKILNLAKQISNNIVWIKTTPIDDDMHGYNVLEFRRLNEDVITYNNIAEKIAKSKSIHIIDLYSFTERFPNATYDGVHFEPYISQIQAGYIIGHLSAWFGLS